VWPACGATATFAPASIAANGGAQTVTLPVKTATSAKLEKPAFYGGGSIAFALLLLPLAGIRRMRRVAQKLSRGTDLALLLLLSLGAVAGLSGCGGSHPSPTPTPKSYTSAVTASSGSAQHTATLPCRLSKEGRERRVRFSSSICDGGYCSEDEKHELSART